MKIHACQQRSVEWMLLRSGIPTASEFDSLITPEGKIRAGETPKTYLNKKLAEKWQGGPLAGFNTFDMDIGTIVEDEALPWFEFEYGISFERVGFITSDSGLFGCSPDGWNSTENYGIEIKCPAVHTHVGYLLAGQLPKDYIAQVQGSMFVTGAKQWKFLSYCRHFPPLAITVERDEEFHENLWMALDKFAQELEAGFATLTRKNGGPPKHMPKADRIATSKPELTYLQ